MENLRLRAKTKTELCLCSYLTGLAEPEGVHLFYVPSRLFDKELNNNIVNNMKFQIENPLENKSFIKLLTEVFNRR